MQTGARPPSALVGRVYVRHGAPEATPLGHPARPGPEWMQIGALSPDLALPDYGEILVMVDVDASDPTASLSDHLPRRADALHLHGRTPPARRWLEQMAGLGLVGLAIDTLPAPAELARIADCGATLEALTLGRTGLTGRVSVAELGFLGGMTALRQLGLYNLDLRGEFRCTPLGVHRLTASVDPGRQPRSASWPGLEWVEAFPHLRDLVLTAPGLEPASLERLARASSLRSLTLRWCRVTDGALKSWGALPALETLDLRYSEMAGGALPPLIGFVALREFAAEDVTLGEAAVRALAALPVLETVAFSRSALTVPLGLLAGSRLSALDLSGCDLLAGALRGIGDLEGLQALDLSSTECGDAEVGAIMALPTLEVLSLSECTRVSLRSGAGTSAFDRLRSLDVSDTAVDAAGLDFLSELPRLEVLRATDLSSVTLADAPGFSLTLRELYLDRTPLGLGATEAISRCGGLHALSLHECPLDHRALAPLRRLSGLQELRVAPLDAVPEWLLTLPALESLAVDGLDLSDADLDIISRCNSLRTVDLHRCRIAVSAASPGLAESPIRTLVLTATTFGGTDSFRNLMPPNLRVMDLSDSGVQDGQLAGLDHAALETLILYQTAVTVPGLLHLGSLPRLHALLGPPIPGSDSELRQLLARFPACWSLLVELPSRIPQAVDSPSP